MIHAALLFWSFRRNTMICCSVKSPFPMVPTVTAEIYSYLDLLAYAREENKQNKKNDWEEGNSLHLDSGFVLCT